MSSKNESIITKMKVSFSEKNLLYFKDSIIFQNKYFINPNKAGLFEGSFFWGGGQFDPPPL